MKTTLSIRRFCKSPSKPQVELFEYVRGKIPSAKLEYPITLKRGLVLWIDVAVPRKKLAIEYDGSYWHSLNESQGKLKDITRDKILSSIGWTVVRVKEGDDYRKKLAEVL